MATSCSATGARQDATVLLASGEFGPEVTVALRRLTEADLGPDERRAAALVLLSQDSRDAERALAAALAVPAGPAVWRAVAQAVALHPQDPPRSLAKALVARLGGPDPQAEADLAEALGRFGNGKLTKTLIKLATNPAVGIEMRRGAILALGHRRTQNVADVLLALINLDQPEAVQDTAFDGLESLTGLDEFGHDREAWMRWWSGARRWSADKWHDRLMQNLTRRAAVHRARLRQTVDRLVESQRAFYRTSTAEDQPAVMAYMLKDTEEPIRQLALDLARQRLEDDLPFDVPLRDAVRSRLVDRSAQLRREAALLLRDLPDEPAADLVALRLAGGHEPSVSVLRAYLLMMARLPRREAVEPALSFLAEDNLRGEAAAALAAAVDRGLLNLKQASRAARQVRRDLDNQRSPPPQVVTLLGKPNVGDDEDWDRIARWVDSPDGIIKQAAAQAWAESDRSLKLLAERVTDPIIRPIVIAAARSRGDDPWTLRALAAHRPEQVQAVEAWQRALVAMAQRVPPHSVLDTALQLEHQGQPAALLDQLLSAAIDRNGEVQRRPLAWIPPLLKRGETRLALGNALGALADFQQIVDMGTPLTVVQRDRLNRGRIRAHLHVGQIDLAFAAARQLLGPADSGGLPPSTNDPIIDRFIELAQHYTTSQRTEEARQILISLRLVLGPAIKPQVAQRIALLEASIAGAVAPQATVEPTPDGPGDSPGPKPEPADNPAE